MRMFAIALIVAGALLTVPIPVALMVLHFRHIESLPSPTPEDLREGTRTTLALVAGGFLVSLAGGVLILVESRRPKASARP